MPLKIMSLTDAAVERINEIIEDSDKPVVGVRVGIKNAGCAGQAYTLDYVSEAVAGDDARKAASDFRVAPVKRQWGVAALLKFAAKKSGRGLAPDDGVSVIAISTEPPPSGASPLPH
jgi:iron-sulfur cluster assembly protein